MTWYYASGEQQIGPLSVDQMNELIRSGQVRADTLVWRDGMGDWMAAGQTGEFSFGVEARPATAVAAGSPYQSPQSLRPGGMATGVPITTYLWQSIVVTIFCCWPLGIPAIVYAASVSSKQARGDTAGALDASKKAAMWCWISFAVGLVAIIGYIVLMVFFGMSEGF